MNQKNKADSIHRLNLYRVLINKVRKKSTEKILDNSDKEKSFLVICQENFEKILMGFPVKRAHFTIICFAKRKNKRQFDSLFGSASSCSPVYSWFLASNPKTSRTSLRDVSASALLC